MRTCARRSIFVVFFLVACAALLFAAPADHVVIVSVDGGRPDAILMSNTPNLRHIAANGAYTWWAQTIDPSSTLPAHCSMLTGCKPSKHGITWNDRFRPDAGYVRTTTCFELAKRAKMGTAMFVAKSKLEHIAKPGTVDKFEVIGGGARAVAATAAKYFTTHKPALMFVHFADPDAAGHAHGWGSPEQRKAFEECDKAVGILWQGVRAGGASRPVVIITADHGGHLKSHGSRDPRDMTIPWLAYGPGIVKPTQIEREVWVYDTAPTALWLLGLAFDTRWDGRPVAEIASRGKQASLDAFSAWVSFR
ncbi:MAG: alkaline phosphatase family protein [Armatimonadetes bacterium]|nr:alkaline phosphatase family protein [Armatimonadota bacterium]